MSLLAQAKPVRFAAHAPMRAPQAHVIEHCRKWNYEMRLALIDSEESLHVESILVHALPNSFKF